jgi:hypothetical protein
MAEETEEALRIHFHVIDIFIMMMIFSTRSTILHNPTPRFIKLYEKWYFASSQIGIFIHFVPRVG